MALSDPLKRQLYFESGGYCMNPECTRDLLPYFMERKRVNIADLAHIIGQSENGPRGESTLTLEERDSANNIVLLCKICHKAIDTNPDEFSVEELHKWKKEHIEKIKALFSVPNYKTRNDARKAILQLMQYNKEVFDNYGPFSKHMNNPMTNAAEIWEKKCVEFVIPNNRAIVRILDKNLDLLNEDELKLLEKFRHHIDEFEYNKVSGKKNPLAPAYPTEFNDILKEG